MRYKLLCCALVLLIATPILAQEFSPIVIETGKPAPSIVKSGEPFKVTYRAKFFDTVLIFEEQMRPDNLALEKIEVIGLEIDKNPFDRPKNDTLGFVNVWDFTYTFRIIQPEKKVYIVPSFNFIWVEKSAGVTEDETKEKEKPREIPTEEVGVGYVSSIVKPPPLDIRDEIIFVSPIAKGVVLRRWAYGVIGTVFLSAMVVAFRFRNSKVRQSLEAGQETPETAETADDVFVDSEPILSPNQARKKFLKELKQLHSKDVLDLTKKIRFLVRTLLLAELQGMIRNSMSDNEIYAKLIGLDAKQKKQIRSKHAVMIDLARRLQGYQKDIDLGSGSPDPVKEITELRTAVFGLKIRKRILSFAKRLAGEGQ